MDKVIKAKETWKELFSIYAAAFYGRFHSELLLYICSKLQEEHQTR